VIAQITIVDIAASVAIPFVLRPSGAAHAALGTAMTGVCGLAAFLLSRSLRAIPRVKTLRKEGKRRQWAIDLRVALIALFILAWVAQSTGASLLIAGFGAGLMVAAIGGPKRLSTEVLGIAGGFFVPLFFVVLGARIELRGIVEDPEMIALTGLLVVLTVGVHALASSFMGQRLANGLVASAQLGVPAAIAALGLSEQVLSPVQAEAIVAAAMVTIVICGAGAARIARRPQGGGSVEQAMVAGVGD
jgi:Kef-type K+ transport system membrane component KefB